MVAPDVAAFRRGDGFGCAVNVGDRAAPLPGAGRVLLASGPVAAAERAVQLPPDGAVWFVPA